MPLPGFNGVIDSDSSTYARHCMPYGSSYSKSVAAIDRRPPSVRRKNVSDVSVSFLPAWHTRPQVRASTYSAFNSLNTPFARTSSRPATTTTATTTATTTHQTQLETSMLANVICRRLLSERNESLKTMLLSYLRSVRYFLSGWN
jgi:hypothetical protein